MRAEVVVRSGNRHGEGIFWSSRHGLLMWTDIFGESVWTFDPISNEHQNYRTPGRVCCFATRKGHPWNEVIAAFAEGFAFLDIMKGKRDNIAAIEAEFSNTRLNDGRTDRHGNFVVGGMDEGGKGPASSVYQFSADLKVKKLFGDVGCANGTCFSADGKSMWFADSVKGEMEHFDYNGEEGVVYNRRSIGRTPSPGVPDGSCVDAEGHVWNAVWEGYRVERWSPDGKITRTIEVPVKKPTCCTFGGPNLETLYITSSRLGETPDDLAREPQAGHLFSVKPGVTGLNDAEFGG